MSKQNSNKTCVRTFLNTEQVYRLDTNIYIHGFPHFLRQNIEKSQNYIVLSSRWLTVVIWNETAHVSCLHYAGGTQSLVQTEVTHICGVSDCSYCKSTILLSRLLFDLCKHFQFGPRVCRMGRAFSGGQYRAHASSSTVQRSAQNDPEART